MAYDRIQQTFTKLELRDAILQNNYQKALSLLDPDAHIAYIPYDDGKTALDIANEQEREIPLPKPWANMGGIAALFYNPQIIVDTIQNPQQPTDRQEFIAEVIERRTRFLLKDLSPTTMTIYQNISSTEIKKFNSNTSSSVEAKSKISTFKYQLEHGIFEQYNNSNCIKGTFKAKRKKLEDTKNDNLSPNLNRRLGL